MEGFFGACWSRGLKVFMCQACACDRLKLCQLFHYRVYLHRVCLLLLALTMLAVFKHDHGGTVSDVCDHTTPVLSCLAVSF